ncbi:unnamed protein product [Didymodactylos carnosus]|uniref:Arrestin C-terminal-like domain-containing protein n=1 Tax=Didymodactylos carnosus TaxID=1234261 RepID=A0A814RGD3_9BILA|nr:unnamed protein product [Didymodactylos carnosus]CAF1157938.1 unnamed protein product [Didymodactylos carnosus]CAF3897420.1 unnamed protein product [Didymodactylos carnosus]CAF3969511.1 unnamed protein product [Didymodactylos carnosus]
MGSGSSRIAITFDRGETFYFANEIVSGKVQLNIIGDDRIKVDEVYLTLTGEIGYTTTKTLYTSKGGKQTRTEYHDVPFFQSKIVLAHPEPPQTELIYTEGQYSWLFSIPLTAYLPPTVGQPHKYPHVCYYVQVVLNKPWYKPNTRQTFYITVFPRVNLLHITNIFLSTIYGNQNRKDVTLKGALNKLGFVPGETISSTLEIHNPKHILIKHINISLVDTLQIASNRRRHYVFRTTLPRIINTHDETICETFSVIIPSMYLAPSYKYTGGLRSTAHVCISYALRFEVKVEGIFTNFDITIPITIGTEPAPPQLEFTPQNLLTVTYTSPNDDTNIYEDDNEDSPPSYESVMAKRV